MPRSSFVFYFPYRGFGGVPILFLRMAEKLATENHAVYVIDFIDGYMAKNRSTQVNFIEYTDTHNSISIPPNSNLILQSDLPWGLPQNFKCDEQTKILFWNCYPYNFIPVLPGKIGHFFLSRPNWMNLLLHSILNSARKKCRNLVEYLEHNKAVVFMDEPNLHMTQWALKTLKLQNNYLPIPVETSYHYEVQPLHQKMQIAWLGRIADFKINSVLRLIEDLKKNRPFIKKDLHLLIIGSGEYEDLLNQTLSEVKEFTFEIIKGIPQAELHHFLNQNIDILFAMGTSALEGGLAQVPTVLMNFSYSKISENYKYNFLSNTRNYSLGDLINSKNLTDGSDLLEILTEVSNDKSSIAQKTHSYVLENHSLPVIIKHFLNYSESNNLKYNSLLKSVNLKKPYFYFLWSVIKYLKNKLA